MGLHIKLLARKLPKMASVDVSELSKSDKDELVCTYAALLLHDSELEITGDKLSKVIKASGNEVEVYWPGLFAKALEGQDIGALLANVGSAAPAGGAGADAAGGAGGAAPAEEKKEEKKEEEPEEEVDMGGLFGGGDDDY